MNGEPLEPIHGFPMRLMVPGWYGVASVKWLGRIRAIDHTFSGYYQTKKYTVQRRAPQGAIETVVLGPMAVKSEIIRPQAGETLGVGPNRLFGVAWAGQEAVSGVEISTDGGATWSDAELLGPTAPYSWTLWEYIWEASASGRFSLLARATSASGRVQPSVHDPLLGGYQVHFVRAREIAVESRTRAQARYSDVDTLVYDMNAFAEENSRRPLDVELEVSEGAGI